MKRKGIGPRALGSPFKQTTKPPGKKYPDVPPAFKTDAAKKDFQQFKSDYASSQRAMSEYLLNHKATGGLEPVYPETFFMSGGAFKAAGNLLKGGKTAFNLAKSATPAWKSAATTVAGALSDEAAMAGAEYLDDQLSKKNKNKKNKK